MTTMTETAVATQVYQVYVRATPEQVWNALTQPEWTDRYGYRGRVDYELYAGGAYRAHASDAMCEMGAADVIIDGEVLEADAPRKLVQTWNALFDDQTAAEPATRLTFEIEDVHPGVTRLTVRHDLEGAPALAALVSGSIPNTGGGWPFVLSDLKTLLETGAPFDG